MKVTAATASLFLSILCIVDGWQYWEQPLAMSKPNKNGIYEFDLRIEHALTMTMKSTDGSTPIVDFSPDNQVWSQRDPNFRTKCSQNYTLLDASDEIEKMDEILATVLQWDGKHHKIVTVSGKSPGQPIVVPLDAKIQLRLHNLLLTESVTLHVHGMSLRNRWWNDGVPFVQQCPIGPGAVYTYRFVADTPGTQWFHGHLMGDRSTGLLGGFVVLRPDERTHFMVDDNEEKGGVKRANLTVGRQYLAILQDRNPQAIQDAWLRLNQGLVKWAGYQLDSDSGSSDACIQPENAGPPRTGPFFGFERLSSVLVNQKGWHNQDDIRQRPSQLPLANFAIKNAENVLLRLINGASMQSYYVWLEEHPLWVVAADGTYVKPKKVDSLLIHPGERYDILVRGFSTPNRQLFRFIFDSFDHFMANISTGEVRQTVGLANLRYEDSDGGNRTAKFVEKTLASQQSEDSDIVDLAHKQCSGPSGPCKVLNCPHAQFYTGPRNYTCLTNDQLENAETEEETLNSDLEKIFDKKRRFHELMLNVHAGLNGWYYKMPAEIPYFHQGNLREIAQLCDPEKCDRWEEECRCFHHYEFGLGDIVQITVSTYANMPHPFHIHGTKFYVLKTGLMGDNYALNEELQCAGANKYCLELKWKNASYSGGHIPNMNKNPVLRDTVLVPNKGYVVIRFVASNPGWFFAHCHLLFHNMDGMAFAYKVDAASGPSILPKPPANFPRNCGHFDGGEEEDDEQPAPLNGSERRMQNAGLLLCHVFIVLLAKIVIHFNK